MVKSPLIGIFYIQPIQQAVHLALLHKLRQRFLLTWSCNTRQGIVTDKSTSKEEPIKRTKCAQPYINSWIRTSVIHKVYNPSADISGSNCTPIYFFTVFFYKFLKFGYPVVITFYSQNRIVSFRSEVLQEFFLQHIWPLQHFYRYATGQDIGLQPARYYSSLRWRAVT